MRGEGGEVSVEGCGVRGGGWGWGRGQLPTVSSE